MVAQLCKCAMTLTYTLKNGYNYKFYNNLKKLRKLKSSIMRLDQVLSVRDFPNGPLPCLRGAEGLPGGVIRKKQGLLPCVTFEL